MRAAIALILTAALAGCCGTAEFERPPSTGEPWDLTYLIDADPSTVTSAALTGAVGASEARLRAATVEGVVWPVARSDGSQAAPDLFGSGGDSLLFSGVAAAGWAWRWRATGDPAALGDLQQAVAGLRLLTHVTGTPGVLARCALPLARSSEFGWPWPHREPFVAERGGYGYYTRATRDQLTGLELGLVAVWRALDGDASPQADALRAELRQIGRACLDRLIADDWRIRDENGENDTNADDVDGYLRLNLEAFVAVAEGASTADFRERYEDLLTSTFTALESWANRFNNADQYYANNLRVIRSLTAALLAPSVDPALSPLVVDHARDSWWRYVSGHRTAWFDAAWMIVSGEDRNAQARYSLASLSLRPSRGYPSPYVGQEDKPGYLSALANCTEGYIVDPHLRKPTGYFTWQKEPWDVGEADHADLDGLSEDNGLSLMAAYWLWRYANLP